MKNRTLFFLLVVLLIIFQLALLPIIFSSPFTPNVILLLAISTALLFNFSTALFWAVICGLSLGLFSFERFGFSAILLTIVVYSVSFFKKRFLIESKSGGFIIIIILISISTFFYQLTSIAFSYNSWNFWEILKSLYFLKNIWKEIIFNLILFTPIFFLVRKFISIRQSSIYEISKLKK